VGGIKKKSEKRIKKEEYWQKLWKLTEKYKKALLVDVDNVSSLQLNKIRYKLRALDAKMIMGKNVSSYYTLFHLVDLDESRS
jgi:ribosomal protein L10